jgi:SNF2 family DNA or RNA helicase
MSYDSPPRQYFDEDGVTPITLTIAALRYLSDRCDGALARDGQGFNGMDSKFGKSLASQNRLVGKQEPAALKLLRTYKKQLAAGGFEIDELVADYNRRKAGQERESAAATGQPSRIVDVSEEFFVLMAPWDASLVDAFRFLPDRSYRAEWNGFQKVNRVPIDRCLEVEQFGQRHGFTFTDAAQRTIADQRAIAEAERERTELLVEASKAADADIELAVEGLYPFQRAGVQYILNRRRTFVADEMGLGKTVQALAAVEEDEAYPLLVICPKSVVGVWRKECRHWLPHRTVRVIDSTSRFDKGSRADINVMHYDVAFKRFAELMNVFRALVLDESHYIKNRKAQRTGAVIVIAGTLTDSDPLILCLSGTPLVNRPAELLTQLGVMRRLEELGGYRNYYRRYCASSQTGAQNLNELNVELRSTCMVRRLKKDVLTELPAKRFDPQPVEIDNWDEYRYAERQFLRWVRETQGDDAARRAARAETLVRMNNLRRLVAEGKLAQGLQWCHEFLESTDEKLVVFAYHRPVQDAVFASLAEYNPVKISAEMSDEERERAWAIDFQTDDSVRVIVCGLTTGGLGITLTAASNAVFFEYGWTPKDMLQAVDRCHRIGQRDSVTGWELMCPLTIDDYMIQILAEKQKIMEEVLDGHAAAEIAETSIMDEVLDMMLAAEDS